MTARRIVVASSSIAVRTKLRLALEAEGHLLTEVEAPAEIDSEEMLGSCHLLILASPLDGCAVHGLCREVRRRSKVAVLAIGESAGTNLIDALNAGADEYVTWPFVAAELAARVRALLRRVVCSERIEIVLPDRAIDMNAHKINGPAGQVSLTPKEYLVLRYLIEHANEPRTHRELAQTIWQRDGSGDVEYVRIVIQQLRRKLEPNPSRPRYIVTERSVGYRFQIPVEAGTFAATA